MVKYDIIRETYSEPSRSQWLGTVEAASEADAVLRGEGLWDESPNIKATGYITAVAVEDIEDEASNE